MRSQSAGAKVIVIGLDGATPDLLNRWVAEGKLPNIASVAERGYIGPLRSTPNFLSSSAWPSFATGLQPGNHGIFYFRDRIPGTYQTTYQNASKRDGIALWSALSLAGKRVASLFVPMTWPVVPVNGILVSGWLAPSIHDPYFAYPREFTARALQVVPHFHIHSGMTEYVRKGNYAEPLRQKLALLKDKADVAVDVLGSEYWDLFMVVFHETDPVQHFFWHFQDPTHPQYNMPGAESFRSAVFELYRAADEAVGRLLEIVGEDAYIFIMSDHGAGPNTRGYLYLKNLLRAHGLEVSRPPSLTGATARWLRKMALHTVPEPVRHRILFRFKGLRERLARRAFETDVDWAKTQAYAFWCGTASEPWLNVRGRDPEGIVEPGEEYDQVVQRVTELLHEALDPLSGEPVVQAVRSKQEIYCGPYVDRAPDLFIEWRPDVVVHGLRMGPQGEIINKPVVEDPRTGDHRPFGVLVAAGPPGTVGESPQNANIADLAPTIYGLLDMAPPHPLDGRAWTELFPQVVRVHPPDREEITTLTEPTSAREAEAVEKRLEDLGYL
ncbi:MAG: alkaline phosphatase family protein [Candidatus Zipacnadales bacterium]